MGRSNYPVPVRAAYAKLEAQVVLIPEQEHSYEAGCTSGAENEAEKREEMLLAKCSAHCTELYPKVLKNHECSLGLAVSEHRFT